MSDNPALMYPIPSHPGAARMRHRIIFLATMWILALTPFLLWRGTWYGRPLSEQQIGEYLHDKNTKHILMALAQLSDRIQRHDATVLNWYPGIVHLAEHSDEAVRATVASIMGLDPTSDEFHEALGQTLHDPSPAVRINTALSLARFGDARGHDEVLRTLSPMIITAPASGTVSDRSDSGEAVKQFTTIVRIDVGENKRDVMAPVAGRITQMMAERGQPIVAGTRLAVLYPSPEQLVLTLQALHAIGRADDLPRISELTHPTHDIPEKVRQQAISTERAIHERAKPAR